MSLRHVAASLLMCVPIPALWAQQNKVLVDAPLVVAGELESIDQLLDLDGDGIKDAAGWWWETGDSVALMGFWNQNGALKQAWSVTPDQKVDSKSTQVLAVGELTGDTQEDLVFALDQWVRVYRSQGFSPPALAQKWKEPYPVKALVVSDFNGDSVNDLAVLWSGQIELYLNVGGTLVLKSEMAVAAEADQLIRTEVNGDGGPDLLAVEGGEVGLYPVVAGVIQPGKRYTHGLPHPMPTSGDIDGDHDEDIVIFDMAEYLVLRRTGRDSFTPEPVVSGGPATHLADVDLDGDLDGACCGGGGPPPPDLNWHESIFRISLNDGTGSFAPAFEISGLGARHLAGVYDLDRDGDPDLIAGRCVYYAHGPIDHDFQTRLRYRQAEASLLDLDGDADLDAGVVYPDVQRNSGDGTFVTVTPIFPAPPTGTTYVGPGFPGDFDGDGDPDLIVSHEAGATFLGMRLLLNNGGGGFVDGGDAAGPGVDMNEKTGLRNRPLNMLAADAEGDGDLDLFIGNGEWPLTGRVWLNDGAGFFTEGQDFRLGVVQAVADLNGDGIPDVVWVSSDKIDLMWGAGDGTFATGVTLYCKVSPANDHVAVADLDGDQDLDLVVSRGDTYLFTNDGYGHFSSSKPFAKTWGGVQVTATATDLDVDGSMDVILFPAWATESASWIYMRNAAAGTWVPPVMQTFRTSVAADVDGDGDPDLLGDVIVFNRRFEGPAVGERRQFGSGTAGTGAMVPTLGARGPFRPGLDCELRVSGAVGDTWAFLVTGFAQSSVVDSPFPGMTCYVPPWSWSPWRCLFPVSGQSGLAGDGRLTIPYTIPLELSGVTLFHQVYVADPTAPYHFACTGGLQLSYGQ